MIEIISPAGFEAYFRQLAALAAASAVTPQELGRLSEQYGLPFPPRLAARRDRPLRADPAAGAAFTRLSARHTRQWRHAAHD